MKIRESYFYQLNLPLVKDEFLEFKNISREELKTIITKRNIEHLSNEGFAVKKEIIFKRIKLAIMIVFLSTIFSFQFVFKQGLSEDIAAFLGITLVIIGVIYFLIPDNNKYDKAKAEGDLLNAYYLREYKRIKKSKNYIDYLVSALKYKNNKSHVDNLLIVKEQILKYSAYLTNKHFGKGLKLK